MAGGAPQWVAAMHMMSYDQGARHSTWEFAERVARQGAELLPAAKVTHGLPFYGRHVRTGESNPNPNPNPNPSPSPSPNPSPSPSPNPSPNPNPNPDQVRTGDWKSWEDLVQN